ncbi:MAG: hypothetical protein K6T94_25405 [Paenibacillus sp.]|nr:hypothetical protein [Paenibacillus sp.]
MRKTIIIFYSAIIIFFILVFIIINNLFFRPISSPKNYEMTFGYRTNDYLAFVDSAPIFTTRDGLKAQISFPELAKGDFEAKFKVTRLSDGVIVRELKIKNKAGVSGQIIDLSAASWPSGSYECTYESNNKVLAKKNLMLQ